MRISFPSSAIIVALAISASLSVASAETPSAPAAAPVVATEPTDQPLARHELKALARLVATEEGLEDPELFIALVQAESNWDPKAVSHKGAQGLTQLMPATAKALGIEPTEVFDPVINLRGGARWFGMMIEEQGSIERALAAYNAGGHRAQHPFSSWPAETRGYVVKILSRAGYASNDPEITLAIAGGEPVLPTSQTPIEGVWIGGISSMRSNQRDKDDETSS